MTSYTGTLVAATNHGHPPASSLIAAGVLAVGFACVVAFAEMLPPVPAADLALPPVQSLAVPNGDTSLPAAATVFSAREVGLEESAPTI